MQKENNIHSGKLLHGELSYKIMGIVFDVYNEIGGDHYEKNIQNAIARGFDLQGMKYQKELKAPVIYKNEVIGHYFLDFLVEDQIVLEIKRGMKFSKKDFQQVKAYLEAKNLKLGILVLFSNSQVKFTRVLNIY